MAHTNPLANELIRKLSPPDQALLMPRCVRVQLEAGTVLSTPNSPSSFVYFLAGSSVAQVVRNEMAHDAPSLAVGLIGNEGAVGLQRAMGMGAGVLTLEVQTSGNALQIEALKLGQLIERKPSILLMLCRYLWTSSQEMAVMAAQIQTHDVYRRLAGWIALSALRVGDSALHLTHIHLAHMLGVRRASVSDAAIQLKTQGLIEYKRGRVLILDLDGLRATAL
jgi:CRP-like cAMP-binding protein